MNSKKTRTDNAAGRMANILEEHLAQLSPEDRADKIRAFHQVVSKIAS